MKDRHRTVDDARAHAVRTARRIGWDGQHAKAICGRTHPAPGPLSALRVCVQKVNHDGPCFEWPDQ